MMLPPPCFTTLGALPQGVCVCVRRLLDVIAGRKDPRGLRSGQVLVDNKVVTSELRLISAYVVQVSKIFQINLSHRINCLSCITEGAADTLEQVVVRV